VSFVFVKFLLLLLRLTINNQGEEGVGMEAGGVEGGGGEGRGGQLRGEGVPLMVAP